MQKVIDRVFGLSADVRYVAIYHHGQLASAMRSSLENASAAESDKYEELLVNPTLLTLARQRGNIDCGGLEYLIVRYGSFFEIIHPTAGGHLSVGVEPTANPLTLVPGIREVAGGLSA
jgi:hypothetical protein